MRTVNRNTTAESLSQREFFGLSWPLILCCIAIISLVFNGNKLFGDGDTHWHIAAAKWMVEHGQVLDHDVFSHTFKGAPWNSHEWLSAIVLYAAYQAASWPGVVVLTALAYVSALGLIARFLLGRLEPAYAILLAVFAGASMASHLLARPHILVLPILIYWAISCIHASENQRTPPWILAPMMILWANMHGSFVVGIGLVVIFGSESWLRADRAGGRTRVVREWGIFLGVVLLAALISPHSYQAIIFPFRLNQMSYMLEIVGEWQSPNFQHLTMQEMWILGVIGFAIMLGLRVPLVRAVLLLVLFHMSLKHVRHIDLMGALAPLLIATPLAVALKGLHPAQKSAAALDHFFLKGARHASPIISMAALVVSMVVALALTLKPLGPSQQVAPTDAIAAVKRLGVSGNVFNGYVFGGYLIYLGIPVFIDGRADMYGDEFLRRTVDAYNASPGKLLPLLQQYDVGWTLLAPDTAAISVLDGSAEWRRIYADDYAVVHQKIKVSAN